MQVEASTQICGASSVKSDQTLRVNGSGNILRSGPSSEAEKLINKKASEILKTTHYLSIDNTTTVLEECTQGDWSRVRVVEPDWLRASHIGWVPSSTLRRPARSKTGEVIFTEEDFIWDEETRPHKKTLIAGVNKIHKENSRCKYIDPATAYVSSRGTKTNPVFFVTCGKGAQVFNVFFSEDDLSSENRMSAAQHIDRTSAIDLCEGYAKQSATHPSTVKFSRIMDLGVTDHPNGRTTVLSSFSAKNSFNLELKHDIRCLLDSTGLIEATITESLK